MPILRSITWSASFIILAGCMSIESTEAYSSKILNYHKVCMEAANAHLSRIEKKHSEGGAVFSLSDYKTVSYLSKNKYIVEFEYINDDPSFEIWEGHPFHFEVELNTINMSIEIIGGE